MPQPKVKPMPQPKVKPMPKMPAIPKTVFAKKDDN
jgi:hypothetical protein